MHIRSIDYMTALNFFLDHKGFKQKLTMTPKGEWFGAFVAGEDEPIGIVSTQQIGKFLRVKTLFVRQDRRRQGVATALVKSVAKGACTAFAFDASRGAFEAAGFAHEKTQKNGVHFMRKPA